MINSRIVVADEYPVVLEGLQRLFCRERYLDIVATCQDGEEALAAIRTFRPQILISDYRLPKRDGIALLREIQNERLGTRVVFFTANLRECEVVEAFQWGAGGIVLKKMPAEALLDCVRQLAGTKLPSVQTFESEAERPRFTSREEEIIQMVAAGMRNREIAMRLSIAEGTVKVHLHNVFAKLDLSSRVELTLYANQKIANNLATMPPPVAEIEAVMA